MDLKLAQSNFLEYLEIEKNHSSKTLANYDRYLRKFFEFSKVQDSADITEEVVRKFRVYLNRLKINDSSLTIQTQNNYLITLRQFLRYLAKKDIPTLVAEKIELPKIPMRDIQFLEAEEINRLLEAPQKIKEAKNQRSKGIKNKSSVFIDRDQAILETLFSTGLRVSELCSLDIEKINLKSGEFSVRGKGQKIRTVFISDSAKTALKKYLEGRTDLKEPLFVNQNGQRLTPRSIERLIKKYAIVAGLTKKVVVHSLRHAFATDLLRSGADLRSIQEMLGHASISTTQIYTHFTNPELKKIHQAFHRRKG
ncbi:tyrosine-type recombinase/integrase [Candidatus Azambacteria bacterium]|nr:tyrosine-type recombinase/integrase [Candidatus Azambacteria bacterium]